MRGDLIIGAVLAVFAAALICIAIADWTAEKEPTEEDMGIIEWGAVIYAEADEASGALEISTVSGQPAVIATDLGSGSYRIGSATYTYQVIKAHVDAILTMGQSNAAYYRPINASEATPVPEPGTAFYWGYESGMAVNANSDTEGYAIYDFIGPSGLRVGDKGPAECATYYRLTGVKVLWLSLGIPAKKIAAWDEGNSAWTLDSAWMAQAMPLVNQYFEISKVWATWAQGETDAGQATTEASYTASFQSLVSRMADGDLGLVPDAWFLVCGRDAIMNRNGVNVNEYLRNIAETESDVYLAIDQDLPDSFTTANGLLDSDAIHYTQKGDNLIAVALAKYIVQWQGFIVG